MEDNAPAHDKPMLLMRICRHPMLPHNTLPVAKKALVAPCGRSTTPKDAIPHPETNREGSSLELIATGKIGSPVISDQIGVEGTPHRPDVVPNPTDAVVNDPRIIAAYVPMELTSDAASPTKTGDKSISDQTIPSMDMQINGEIPSSPVRDTIIAGKEDHGQSIVPILQPSPVRKQLPVSIASVAQRSQTTARIAPAISTSSYENRGCCDPVTSAPSAQTPVDPGGLNLNEDKIAPTDQEITASKEEGLHSKSLQQFSSNNEDSFSKNKEGISSPNNSSKNFSQKLNHEAPEFTITYQPQFPLLEVLLPITTPKTYFSKVDMETGKNTEISNSNYLIKDINSEGRINHASDDDDFDMEYAIEQESFYSEISAPTYHNHSKKAKSKKKVQVRQSTRLNKN
ncbi:OLC1v1015889C1 [Oldenlandia corymbosa var. corymbosa]|uniref:OLC1v1015889C1 n=1 Tax=Oldenlandia corymbosa var. corymbosa TaxID=529605 RepID=A0AAV1E4E6_OLDCO|nr:OLC1v1015889C1 [Oldenlandia corymbosa var. corymbosa]